MTPDPARDQRLRRAFLAPALARVAGLALRPFSLWTLDFCDELGLAFFISAKETAAPVELSGPEQLSALVWGHLAEIDPGEVDDHLFAGTWPLEVMKMHRDERLGTSVTAITEYIAYIASPIDAASITIRPRKPAKGEKIRRDPADLLHPAGRVALIWAVAGGQIQSEAQLDYLYRGMSLPVLLQCYHAACREAQLLTVKPGQKTDAKKLAAVKAKIDAASKAPEGADFF